MPHALEEQHGAMQSSGSMSEDPTLRQTPLAQSLDVAQVRPGDVFAVPLVGWQ